MNETVAAIILSISVVVGGIGWMQAYVYKRAYWRMHGMWQAQLMRVHKTKEEL